MYPATQEAKKNSRMNNQATTTTDESSRSYTSSSNNNNNNNNGAIFRELNSSGSVSPTNPGFTSSTTTTPGTRYESVYRGLAIASPMPQIKAQVQSRGFDSGLSAPTLNKKSAPGEVLFTSLKKSTSPVPSSILQSNNNNNNNNNNSTNNNQQLHPTAAIHKELFEKLQVEKLQCSTPSPLGLSETTCFCIHGVVGEVVPKISKVLADHDVDARFSPQECKWSCAHNHRNKELTFEATLYKVSEDIAYHRLEFQRVMGCAMHFTILLSYLTVGMEREKLISSGQKCKQVSGPKKSDFRALPVPSSFASQMNLTEEAFRPIILMAKSPFVEIQCQALQVIADRVGDDEVSRRILGADVELIGVLSDSLISNNLCIVSCACSTIEAFASDPRLRSHLTFQGIPQRLTQVLSRNDTNKRIMSSANSALSCLAQSS